MFNRPFIIILGVILLLFILVTFLPIIVTNWSWIKLNVDKPNEIGDTIGGIMGPVVGFIGVVVTFLAFWMQYKANEKQFKKFDDQELDAKVEKFENKFYELLKMHRETVNELEIESKVKDSSVKGRRLFIEMFQELQLIYAIVKQVNAVGFSDSDSDKDYYSDKDIFYVAYIIFFNGYSGNDVSHIKPNELLEFKILDNRYNGLLRKVLPCLNPLMWAQFETRSKFEISLNDIKYEFKNPAISYSLFRGHSSILGHYFRGLFQLVSFVVSSEAVNEYKKKYSYIKTIRSQLSNHEQLLLYYNALSFYGKPWLDENFFSEWRIIKNIPMNLAHFYKGPREVLGDKNSRGEYIFELDEISNRIQSY